MTAYELDTLTLANVDEEANDENRLAWSRLFLNAYNEAYTTLCGSVLKPTACEAVTLDGDGRFDPGALQHSIAVGGVVSVKSGKDFSAQTGRRMAQDYGFHRAEDGTVAVPGAPQGGTVWVTYCRNPAALENPTPCVPGSGSSPDLLPEEYHRALCSYAAAAFFRIRRKFERMQVWTESWTEACRSLQRLKEAEQHRLIGLFLPMP